MALSSDGNTLAVGAIGESSSATGIDGNQADNSAFTSGAVYVFTRASGIWSQQAYVKASNTRGGDPSLDWALGDRFGASVALSSDGNTLAVGTVTAGAVYAFTRTGGVWLQQALINPSNTEADQSFGRSVALSSDGNTLAAGTTAAGAVFMFTRASGVWSQQAYVQASNTGADDQFGVSMALSSDGNTLAVGAQSESSSATGIDGNQADNSAANSGAVYVFTRTSGVWSQQAYVKASNTEADDEFGVSVVLSGDGNTLTVGAYGEDSAARGIGGNQADNSAVESGAAYVFTRSSGVWSQQAYVKAPNTVATVGVGDFPGFGFDEFGGAMALSGDGNTLVVGASGNQSAVYIY